MFLHKQISAQTFLRTIDTHDRIALNMMPCPQPTQIRIVRVIREHRVFRQTILNRLKIDRARFARLRTKSCFALSHGLMTCLEGILAKFTDTLNALRILRIVCRQGLQFTGITAIHTFPSGVFFFKRVAAGWILALTCLTGEAWATHSHPFLVIGYTMFDTHSIHRQRGMIQLKSVLCYSI